MIRALKDMTVQQLEARVRGRQMAYDASHKTGDSGYINWCRQFLEETQRDLETRLAAEKA